MHLAHSLVFDVIVWWLCGGIAVGLYVDQLPIRGDLRLGKALAILLVLALGPLSLFVMLSTWIITLIFTRALKKGGHFVLWRRKD